MNGGGHTENDTHHHLAFVASTTHNIQLCLITCQVQAVNMISDERKCHGGSRIHMRIAVMCGCNWNVAQIHHGPKSRPVLSGQRVVRMPRPRRPRAHVRERAPAPCGSLSTTDLRPSPRPSPCTGRPASHIHPALCVLSHSVPLSLTMIPQSTGSSHRQSRGFRARIMSHGSG